MIQPATIVSAYLASPAILADAFASGVLAEPVNRDVLDSLEPSLAADGSPQDGLRDMVALYRQALSAGNETTKKMVERDTARAIRNQEEQLKEILAGIRTGGQRKRNVPKDREGGSYREGSLIDKGGFAKVYRGRDDRTGRTIAVKKPRPRDGVNWNHLLERFQREIDILRRLIHPYIVEILYWSTDPNQPFYAMEYVEGGSLSGRLQTGPLYWAEARRIALQLASALAVVHGEGVVHRDLKPENILIPWDKKNIKLIDFGVALDLHEAEPTTDRERDYGTVEYISPEQLKGSPADSRSDVYSFGVLLYEMLAGRPPFDGKDEEETRLQHIWDPPPPLHQFFPGIRFPPCAEAIVLKALEKHPNRRFQSMVEMFAALQACGEDK